MNYTGLDVHKQFIFATTVGANGGVERRCRIATTREALLAFAGELTKENAVCLESTTNAIPIYFLLSQYAGKVVISNPLQTKAIAHAKIKTDKVDSEALAHLLRSEYLPTVWVPDVSTLALRSQSCYRLALVRQRTQVKNRIHAILHRNLIPKPDVSDLFGKKGLAFLKGVDLPFEERFQMDQELALLNLLESQVATMDERLAQAAVERPEAYLLLSLPGFRLRRP